MKAPGAGPACKKCSTRPAISSPRVWARPGALLTDGRFSGGTSGLSIGHVSPEAAAGGEIGLIENGDLIRIDIPNRAINVLLDQGELDRRRQEREAKGWKPEQPRKRKVSAALKAYALLATSADKGAVRDLSKLD